MRKRGKTIPKIGKEGKVVADASMIVGAKVGAVRMQFARLGAF